jgi:RHS repeat-associated protein
MSEMTIDRFRIPGTKHASGMGGAAVATRRTRWRLKMGFLGTLGALALLLSTNAAVGQTTNYSISAGSGTLTYTETQSASTTCPLNQPPTNQYQTITQYLFNTFAYNGQALSGSITYVSVPSPNAYCPTTGWSGPVPSVLNGSGYYVFFTPSLTGPGTATLDALSLTASPTTGVYGTSVQLQATEQFPNATGTVTFTDGSTTLGSSTMSSDTATLGISTLAVGTHSITASYSGNQPSVGSPVLSFTVNQAPQAITFSPPSSVTYGVAPLTLSATGGASGNAVTFSVSSGPGTLSGTTLTVTGTGTIVVTANQAGNTNYAAAPQVTKSITVNSATITVTANNASRTYGSSNPTLTASYAGFVNGQNSSIISGSPSVTTTATSSSAAGSYSITAALGTLSAPNYTFAFVNGALTVGKATLTVTANSPSKTYGAANPAFSASYAGFVNGDTQSVVSGSPSLTTTAAASSSVGAYTVTAAVGTLSAANYSFSFVNGTLTINKASLTVTANNQSRVYGVSNPSLAVTYAGFVNGDTQSVLSGSPGVSTSATSTSTVGTYPITAAVGTLSATNYSFSFFSGTLTVTKATPTITWPQPSTAANGTYLNSAQLNATTTAAGTFAYSPVSGLLLTPGVQTLSTTFTPTDSTDYNSATASVQLPVSMAPPTGIIMTVAGNDFAGYSGDGGPATASELFWPTGVAFDSAGNLYISDEVNNVIRKVSAATNVISTFAGNGQAGYSGDGGAATSATLQFPQGIAVDSLGNVIIADRMNEVVRQVSTSGTITRIAGTGLPGFSGDGGSATSAKLSFPNSVAVDSSNNIFIADESNARVRKITKSTGIITTVAGNGTAGYTGDGGAATSAELFDPIAVAIDPAGNLYIADCQKNVIRRVSTSGVISTFAGNGTNGYSGDGGPAVSASLSCPDALTVDSGGNVYIADSGNSRVRKVSSFGIITDAGSGSFGDYGDGGYAIEADMSSPDGLAVDSAGNLFLADNGTNTVRAVGGGSVFPLLNWTSPQPITYGTHLGSTQLNATAGVSGTFAYSPASGTTLQAGQQTLSVVFTPTDTTDYATVSETVPLTVVQGFPPITWATPTAIADGTALSSTQLNATSTVAGTFVYSPPAGTTLPAGPHVLTATFTPTDTTDYQIATANVSLDVNNGTQKQDSGTVALSVKTGSTYTTVASVAYSSTDTPASIAEGLAAAVIQSSPVTVAAVNDQVTVASTAKGASRNYPYLLQTTSWDTGDFQQPSFMNPLASGNLEGGADQAGSATTVYSFCVPDLSNSYCQSQFSSSTVGYDPAGNLATYTDSVMGSWSFNYDTLNRLSGGGITQNASSGPAANLVSNYCWNYDAFGNRVQQEISSLAFQAGSGGPSTCQAQSGGTLTTALATFSQTNQILSTNARGNSVTPSYDAAGDVVSDGANQYLYDAEGRICAVASTVAGISTMTGYMYDADGTRVSKGSIQVWSCNPTTAQYATTSDYILNAGGEQFSEYTMQSNGTMAWHHTNVWGAGRLFATYSQDTITVGGVTTQNSLLHFYFDDPLGTRRAQTDYAGNIEQTCASLPYGDAESCGAAPTEHLFTGKERDTESGNDYFGARYYSSAMGRFMSPDWSASEEPVPYAKLDNPQSLNLYGYVLNNPTGLADPDGHAGDCKSNPQLCASIRDSVSQGGSIEDGTAAYNDQQNSKPTTGQKVKSALNRSSAWVDENLAIPVAILWLGENEGEDDLAMEQVSETEDVIEQKAEAAESSVSDKIGKLTDQAKKLFPKKANKPDEDHHITPKYLGGDPNGPTARISAAYHQLITNAFRELAPYGQKVEYSAEQVKNFMSDVYSKYPLPPVR